MLGFERTRQQSRSRSMAIMAGGAAAAVAVSDPVEAGIISSGVVNQHVDYYWLDIDGDTVEDYSFWGDSGKGEDGTTWINHGKGCKGSPCWDENEWVGDGPGYDSADDARNLSLNTMIDSTLGWKSRDDSGGGYIADAGKEVVGWKPGDTGYMGIRFDRMGSDHYGWIHITAVSDEEIVLNQWAYESDADTSLLAGAGAVNAVPEPSTAILLGLGAAGAVLWQKFRRPKRCLRNGQAEVACLDDIIPRSS